MTDAIADIFRITGYKQFGDIAGGIFQKKNGSSKLNFVLCLHFMDGEELGKLKPLSGDTSTIPTHKAPPPPRAICQRNHGIRHDPPLVFHGPDV